MKKHWNKILEWGLWLVVCLPLFAACSDNDEGPGAEPVREKDCEVSVGIRLDIPVLKDMAIRVNHRVTMWPIGINWTYSWCTTGDKCCNIR